MSPPVGGGNKTNGPPVSPPDDARRSRAPVTHPHIILKCPILFSFLNPLRYITGTSIFNIVLFETPVIEALIFSLFINVIK